MEQLTQIGSLPFSVLIKNDEIITYLLSEGRVLLDAPVIFVVLVVAIWCVAWRLRGQWAAEKLEGLKAQMALKDQSLRREKELIAKLKRRSEQRKPRK